jgi:hypothetical protein
VWIAILGGVAVGLIVAMFLVLRQERGYRLLFSDTHLIALARSLEAARAALGDGVIGATAPTFEGVEARWERLPRHLALTLVTRRAVAPAAARFLLAFAVECAHGTAPLAALQVDKRSCALVWEEGALDLSRPLLAVGDLELASVRQGAADRMGQLAVSRASLAAYR